MDALVDAEDAQDTPDVEDVQDVPDADVTVDADVVVDAGGPVFTADFTTLSLGVLTGDLPSGLVLQRATPATVQTGESTVVPDVPTNVARIGRLRLADTPGLVIEAARTNVLANSRDLSGAAWIPGMGATTTIDAAAGPDGVVNADRLQVIAAGYSPYQLAHISGAGVWTATAWLRGGTPDDLNVVAGTATRTLAAGGHSTTWTRLEIGAQSAAAEDVGFAPVDGRDESTHGGLPAGGRDNWVDMLQVEEGDFASEWIPTLSGPGTRAGERLTAPSAVALFDGGRLSLAVTLRPKAGSRPGAPPLRIFSLAVDTYAELAGDGSTLRVSVNGATHDLVLSASWARNSRVQLFVAAGSGVARAAIQVDGLPPIEAPPASSPDSPLSSAGAIDLLCNGTTSQFSAWVERIDALPAGQRPSWLP